jgi:predicted transposase YbfD/YdcC
MSQAVDPATILVCFEDLPDPRIDRNKLHKLVDIVTTALCAVLCGADTWEDIVEFARCREAWFRTFLELPHGIPSHDTFNRVFSLLDPEAFRQCFLRWVRCALPGLPQDVIAIDGKTLRRSRSRATEDPAIHMVSAWAHSHRLVLAQRKTREKSNEITAIPEVLRMLDLTGSVVTIDAMGCQTAIAQQIVDQRGDYVLSLKGNQGSLHDDVALFFQEIRRNCPDDVHPSIHESTDGDHGRVEVRRHWSVDDIDWLIQRHGWPGLTSIGMVESERHIGSEITTETRYFLSSLPKDAQRLGAVARAHWGIENTLHWVLDVAFREDQSRIRKDHAPENFATLRHLALNLIRADKTTKGSVRVKRLRAGWDDAFLAKLLRV